MMKKRKILSSIFISLLSLCIIAVMLPMAIFAADRATDVTEPAEGNIIVRVNVEALSEDKAKLIKRINEIRQEACNEGITFTKGSKTQVTLKKSDYKPIEWSAEMEQLALTRAIEANLKIAHSRPNIASETQNWNTIKFTYSTSDKYFSPHSEILAWGQGYRYQYNPAAIGQFDIVNTGDCISESIEAWYSEKENLTKPNSVYNGQTGHYFALINPDYAYIGLAATMSNDTQYKTCAAGELSYGKYQPGGQESTNQVKTSGKINQLLEVTSSSLSGLNVQGSSNLNVGQKSQYTVVADTVSYNDSKYGLSSYKNVELIKGFKWSLEENEDKVLSVNTNGEVTAEKAGTAKLVATINGQVFTKQITVTASDIPVPQPVSYKVTFTTSPSTLKLSGSAYNEQTVNSGSKITLPSNPSVDGYDFINWTVGNATYKAGEQITINSNTNVVANFKKKEVPVTPQPVDYKVTFTTSPSTLKLSGSAYNEQTVNSGSKITLPSNPSIDGYDFINWTVGNTTYKAGEQITINSNTNVVANFKKKEVPGNYTGLFLVGDELIYYSNGEKNKEYKGLAQIKNAGTWYYVVNGKWDSKYTGLAKKANSTTWYYVSKGKYDNKYIGLARIENKGAWYYVSKGRYNNAYTGLARIENKGAWYYVSKGKYNNKYTGLCKNGNKYYYVKNGKVDFKYTGNIRFNGKVYKIKNGVKI